MIIVDRALRQRAAEGNPVRVGMIGAGFMARGVANQIVNSVPGMRLVAIANRTLNNAVRAYTEAGVEEIAFIGTQKALENCISTDRPAVTEDPMLLCAADGIDCLIDATGAVEHGAEVTMQAIAYGKHVVTMNAELDGTIGPILKRHADKAGVILTGCDGDQPGVQMNLFRFVKSHRPDAAALRQHQGPPGPLPQSHHPGGLREALGPERPHGHLLRRRHQGLLRAGDRRQCHRHAVAKRGMTGIDHTGHVDELTTAYDVDMLRELGGIVDYVVGAKPGPGVFILAAA